MHPQAQSRFKTFLRGKCALLIVITILIVIHLIYLQWTLNYVAKYPIKHNIKTDKSVEKTILYWDTLYGRKDMGLGFGSKIFKNCAVKNCYTTDNKSYMSADQFDAIIFHGARYSIWKNDIPRKRTFEQKYIFYSMESAFNTYFEQKVNNNFYNWTMTFRKDSDIYFPYGLIRKQANNYKMPSVDEIKNRKHKVAWFASNCRTKGAKKRLRYVTELRKYIPVHIYGACGQMKCDVSPRYCYKMMERNYKFYLSFENSFCKDYVTEKLFNILDYNVIPVVYGLANYSTIAPPYSYINVMDFGGPKQLAQYLWFLDKNVSRYLEYFRWKSDYVVEDSEQYALCQLCSKLNKPLNYTWYTNVKEWFFGNSCIF